MLNFKRAIWIPLWLIWMSLQFTSSNIPEIALSTISLMTTRTKSSKKRSQVVLNATDINSVNYESMKLNVSIVTWNWAEKAPTLADCKFIKDLCGSNDIIALGIQELEDIKPRRKEGSRSRAWKMIQQKTIKSHKCIAQHKMGGLQLSIFARKNVSDLIEGYQVLDVACGVGNVLTNKGAICILLRLFSKTVAFINSHLAAHQSKVKERNADYHRIMSKVIDKAQTKWLTKPYAEKKAALQRLQQDNSLGIFSQISSFSVSQPWLGQVSQAFSSVAESVGIGLDTDVTTAITGKREFKFHRLSGEGWDELEQVMSPVISTLKKQKNKDSKSKSMKSEISIISSETLHYQGRLQRKKKKISKSNKQIKVVKETPKYNIAPFDKIFFFGDLNYRIDIPRKEIEDFKERIFPSLSKKSTSRKSKKQSVESIHTKSISSVCRLDIYHSDKVNVEDVPIVMKEIDVLLENDQLRKQMKNKRAFNCFLEGDIRFMPSFKYDKNSDRFDTSKKARSPAWTDRILFSTFDVNITNKNTSFNATDIVLKEYSCFDCRHSDHRPVFATFDLKF